MNFLDTFFTKYYPKIEFFQNEDLSLDPPSIDELNGNDPKFETFRRLLYIGGCKDINELDINDVNGFATYTSKIEKRFNRIIKKHYKQDETIQISIRNVFDKLTVLIHDSSEQTFTIDERAPGFRYYFAFLINKLYFTEINKERDIVFLLDEPGNNLHPKGAKDLLKTFDEISSDKCQLFFTTHNPFLVLRNSLESLLFVKKTPELGTKIDFKPYLNKYQILRKELGILLNDSFIIGDINLIVEGATEKFAFHHIFQDEKYDQLQWVNIYDVGGIPKIPETLKFLGPNNLNQSGIVLLDSDDDAIIMKDKPFFKTMMGLKNWEYAQINDVFDDNAKRTFEDLFPQDIYVDAFNMYCHSLKDLDIFVTDYQNYKLPEEKKLPTPIIETLNEYYLSFISADKRKKASITKQNVIRFLFEIIESDNTKKNKGLEHLSKLAVILDRKIKTIQKNVA